MTRLSRRRSHRKGIALVAAALFAAIVGLGVMARAPSPAAAFNDQVVTDLQVIHWPQGAAEQQCPAGYARREPDLNKGAGGEYIYLCVHYQVRTQVSSYVTKVIIEVSGDGILDGNECHTDNRHLIDVDLNKGAGGSYIYMCFELGSSGTPVRDIKFAEVTRWDAWTTTLPALCAKQFPGWSASNITSDGNDLNGGVTTVRTPMIFTCVLSADEYIDSIVTTAPPPDTTPPTIEFRGATNVDGTPYELGTWTSSPTVTLTWHCADASGVFKHIVAWAVTGEGTHPSTPAVCVDRAGNRTLDQRGPVNIDTTPPTLMGTVQGSPNANGWFNHPVTVTWTCADVLSGIAGSCPAPSVITTEGRQTATATVRDLAGNSTTATSRPVFIDLNPPELTAVATNADGTPYVAGTPQLQVVTVRFNCTDPLSGIASVTPPQTVSPSALSQTVTGNCTDKAGNTTSRSVTITSRSVSPAATSTSIGFGSSGLAATL